MTHDQKSLSTYLIFWSGQALSLLGSRLVQFGLIWWLTRETESATVLAIASLIGLLPQMLLGPFIGTMVDRWQRKRIMLLADGSIAVATALLLVAFVRGQGSLPLVYGLLFVRALGGAFHQPAMLAATSLMVPESQLTRMQGLNQTLQGGLNIISAPLGALLLELMDVQGVLMIDLITAAIALTILALLAVPEPEIEADVDQPLQSFMGQLVEGFRYIRGWTGLLLVILMVGLINMLFVPAASLLPLLVREHFGGGALELGWVEGSFGLGAVIGGVALSAWGGFRRRIVTSLVGLIGLGLAFGGIGLVPSDRLPLAIVGTLFMGVMLPVVNGPLIAALQASVAPAMQGRVLALTTSLATAMTPVGLLMAGPLADILEVQIWYLVGGVVCSLMGIIGFSLPPVLNLEENRSDRLEQQPSIAREGT